MSQIKQWLTNQDGIDKLTLSTASAQTPGDNEVLVQIRAVSLNYRDTEVANGEYNHHKSIHGSQQPPLSPCSDMCGVIEQVGQNVSKWKKGDRVMSTFLQTHLTGQVTAKELRSGLGLPLPGVLATQRVFPEDGLVAVPSYLTDEQACTLPIASVTARMSLNWMRPLGQGGQGGVGERKYVLLQGTGGVAIAGLQIAKASGYKVIITSSSDTKLATARSLGADYTINYRTQPNWHEQVLQLTDNHGADIIFETGGAQTLRKSLLCVAWGGLVACIGYLSGKEEDDQHRTNVNVLALQRNATLKGMINGPRDRFEEMTVFYADHQIQPVIDRVFLFEQGKQAFEYLASGSHFGKVIVKV